MKNYTMFSYEMLMGDHHAKLSPEARLYYIELNFYSNNGFVANPIKILDSNNYDRGILQELISNDDILSIPDRSEVFITAYFAHNPKLNKYTWKNTPYGIYWENKMYVKKNGIAKLMTEEEIAENIRRKQGTDHLAKIIEPEVEPQEEQEESDDINMAETIRIAKTPWLDD